MSKYFGHIPNKKKLKLHQPSEKQYLSQKYLIFFIETHLVMSKFKAFKANINYSIVIIYSNTLLKLQ